MLYSRKGRGGGCHRCKITFYTLTRVPTQLFAVRCTNMTENILAVRISADACYVQQYLLRPVGTGGDTLTCHGTGPHTMVFRLVSGKVIFRSFITFGHSLTGGCPFSALTRAGNRHSRPPSETGSINVTVYQVSLTGHGLPPPEKPTEQLELPVSMDGTFWKLCVRQVSTLFWAVGCM